MISAIQELEHAVSTLDEEEAENALAVLRVLWEGAQEERDQIRSIVKRFEDRLYEAR